MTDDNGKSRGFGFVCYSTISEVQQAISEMNNEEIDGNTLYGSIANRKDQKSKFVPQFPSFNDPGSMAEASSVGFNYNDPHHRNAYPYYQFPAGKNGVDPNYDGAQPWGPQYHMSSTANGLSPVIFAPGTSYTYPGMATVANNVNFRKNGSNNASRGSNGYKKSPDSQQILSRGFRKQYGDNINNTSNHQQGHIYHNYPGRKQSRNIEYCNDRYGESNNAYNNKVTSSSNSDVNNSSSISNKQNGDNDENYFPSSTLSAAIASAADSEAERQVIGKVLYPKVQRHPAVCNQGELAAKLTGMILEINTQELLKWIDNSTILNARIQDAFDQYMEVLATKKGNDQKLKNE